MRVHLRRGLPSTTPAFNADKACFIERLAATRARYTTILSPIGPIIDLINQVDGFVVTGGEPGSICVYQEGEGEAFPVVPGAVPTTPAIVPGVAASVGSYGSPPQIFSANMAGSSRSGPEGQQQRPPTLHCSEDGKHLYVTHQPPDSKQLHYDMVDIISHWARASPPPGTFGSLIYFKYEPFTLTVMTSSTTHAQVLLQAASDAGFREAGTTNLAYINEDISKNSHPVVTIRSAGLAFESLFGLHALGGETFPLINPAGLVAMTVTAAARGAENLRRRTMFHDAFVARLGVATRMTRPCAARPWEPEDVRRARLRSQGLLRKLILMKESEDDEQLREALDEAKTKYEELLDQHGASAAFRMARAEFEHKALQIEKERKREQGQLPIRERGESSRQATTTSGRASGQASSQASGTTTSGQPSVQASGTTTSQLSGQASGTTTSGQASVLAFVQAYEKTSSQVSGHASDQASGTMTSEKAAGQASGTTASGQASEQASGTTSSGQVPGRAYDQASGTTTSRPASVPAFVQASGQSGTTTSVQPSGTTTSSQVPGRASGQASGTMTSGQASGRVSPGAESPSEDYCVVTPPVQV